MTNKRGRPVERIGCAVESCPRPHYGGGFCRPHFQRCKRLGDPGPATIGAPRGRSGEKPGQPCLVDECTRPAYTRGYCNGHYLRLRSFGAVGASTIKAKRAAGTGGRWIDRNGYTIISDGRRKQAEHRLVMEGVLGRELLPGETVHHINGVRSDNRPENLELWVVSQPAGQRVSDILAWANEIIRRYK